VSPFPYVNCYLAVEAIVVLEVVAMACLQRVGYFS